MTDPRTALSGVLLVAALMVAPAGAAAACPSDPAAHAAMARLRTAMAQGRFIAYEPTSLKVVNGRVTAADPAGIRADLTVLRERFNGLITYDAVHGAQQIPAIAEALRFRALIIGVWNPADETEVEAALAAARRFPELVVGISLGNETLFAQRTDFVTLAALIQRTRSRFPGIPFTTTEPFHIYYEPAAAPVLEQLDFLLVNVHPIFQPWFRDAPDSNAAQFVVNVLGKLAPLACGPLLVKETGVPTAPSDAGFSELRQASFYRELRRVLVPSATQSFAYFSAFDLPWRGYDGGPAPGTHAEEAHWGLYDAQRRPKSAARELARLPAPN